MLLSPEKIPAIFRPALYGIVFFAWLLACLAFNRIFSPHPLIGIPQFAGWIALDIFMEKRWPSGIGHHKSKRIINMVARWLVASPVFFIWAVYFLMVPLNLSWLRTHVTHVFRALSLFIIARPSLFFAQVLAYLGICYVCTRKILRFRVFLGVALPLIILFNGYLFFYISSLGGVSPAAVERDPNVSYLMPMPKDHCSTGPWSHILYPLFFPRSLQLDRQKQKLFFAAGAIWADAIWPKTSPCPNLFAVNTDGSGFQATVLKDRHKLIREFQIDEKSDYFYAAGWVSGGLSKISKDILQIEGRIELSCKESVDSIEKIRDLSLFDIYDIYHDSPGNRVFAISGNPPVLFRYDLSDGKMSCLDLYAKKISDYGSILHIIRYDRMNNLLYVLNVDTDRLGVLYEFDPERMELTKRYNHDNVIISMEVDSENNEIFVGEGLNADILVIDRKKFVLKRKIPTPSPTIRKFIVCRDRKSILLSNHLKGRLDEIDIHTGKVLDSYRVGNKPIGMVRDGNIVYIVSTFGVMKVVLRKVNEDL